MAEQAKTTGETTTEAPETKETKAPAEKATGAKKQAKTTEGATGKVYKFTSNNKFLTCAGLGIQFMDGKASTTNIEVAKELVKLDGVDLVEE